MRERVGVSRPLATSESELDTGEPMCTIIIDHEPASSPNTPQGTTLRCGRHLRLRARQARRAQAYRSTHRQDGAPMNGTAGTTPLRVRHVGHITPSSNTVLEPVTALMNKAFEDRVAHHFTRIPVTRIDLDQAAWNQFDEVPMLDAARLLSDAPLDGIVWNGTSGGWRGIEADRTLQRSVQEAVGVPFSTAILAQVDVFHRWGIKRFGLAVPYVDAVADRIVETFAGSGFVTVSRANLGISEITAFAQVEHDAIRDLIRSADSPDAECLIVVCTNLPAALVVEDMEEEIGKPIFDSTIVAFWQALTFAGVRDVVTTGWGRLLRETHPAR